MFVKLVLLITFFWCIFSQLFQRIRNQREIFLLTGTWVDKRSVEGVRLEKKLGGKGVGWTGSWLDTVFVFDYLHNKALKFVHTVYRIYCLNFTGHKNYPASKYHPFEG
jgi:hypothetical protein